MNTDNVKPAAYDKVGNPLWHAKAVARIVEQTIGLSTTAIRIGTDARDGHIEGFKNPENRWRFTSESVEAYCEFLQNRPRRQSRSGKHMFKLMLSEEEVADLEEMGYSPIVRAYKRYQEPS